MISNRFIFLLIAVFFLLGTGCEEGSLNGEKVDYGAQVPEKDVINAVYGYLIAGTQPSATKVGAFVHFASTENIAGGTINVLLADTGQTTINRVEDAKTVTFNIVEKIIEYHQNSKTPEKVTRNFEMAFEKPSIAPATISTTSASLAENPALNFQKPTDQSLLDAVQKFKRNLTFASNQPLHTQDSPAPTSVASLVASPVVSLVVSPVVSLAAESPSPTPPSATFHRLRTWQDSGPPPESVRMQANCGDVPNCTLRYRHVVFDIVTWDLPGGNLIHMELIASPDVPQTFGLNMNPIFPYLPGLMRTCYTRMVPIGTDGHSKTLVSDCNDVVNFTFDIGMINSDEASFASH